MNYLAPLAPALIALTAAPAWSQSAPNAAAGSAASSGAAAVMGVQEVEIAGNDSSDFARRGTSLDKLPADLRDVPQSVTVLSKSLLQSQGAASLADALRNVPGVTL